MIQTATSPHVSAFLADQFSHAPQFNPEIHPQDEMLLFDLPIMKGDVVRTTIHYLAQGKRMCANLRQIIDWYFGGFAHVGRMLDFASGYGRLTRHLVLEMEPARLCVSDIYAEAVAHQQRVFDVDGIVSTVSPDDYPEAGKFDCIYVGSLFTHLPDSTFRGWLKKLYTMLSEGGLLVFSVHDMTLLPAHIARPDSGYFFAAHSESRSLEKAQYGTTYVTEPFVRQCIGKIAASSDRVHRIKRGLANRQDLYLVAKREPRRGNELAFTYGPDGWIEKCVIEADGRIYLKGWAADLNAGDAEVVIKSDAGQVARFAPTMKRPDVAKHFDNPSAEHSGWVTHLPADLPQLLLAKVVDGQGVEHVFSVETPAELVARTAHVLR